MVAPEMRSRVLLVLLRKHFESPRDPFSLRLLRELVSMGWVDDSAGADVTSVSVSGGARVFEAVLAKVLSHMKVLSGSCVFHQLPPR